MNLVFIELNVAQKVLPKRIIIEKHQQKTFWSITFGFRWI